MEVCDYVAFKSSNLWPARSHSAATGFLYLRPATAIAVCMPILPFMLSCIFAAHKTVDRSKANCYDSAAYSKPTS
ncbi:hypothetical protein P8452_64635 [Trifolium repens]|nr:hypothetical protein P8452_64635 [Trifolium repens]